MTQIKISILEITGKFNQIRSHPKTPQPARQLLGNTPRLQTVLLDFKSGMQNIATEKNNDKWNAVFQAWLRNSPDDSLKSDRQLMASIFKRAVAITFAEKRREKLENKFKGVRQPGEPDWP